MAPKGQGPKGKAPKGNITSADVGWYNKGRRDAAGVQEQRWFLRTKKKENRVTSFSPKYVGPPGERLVAGFHGVWDSEEGAKDGIADFVACLNGALEVRAPKPRAAKSTATPCKQEMNTPEEPSLDLVLKRKRAAMKESNAVLQRIALHTELGKAHHGPVNVNLPERLAGMVRKDAPPEDLAELIADDIGRDDADARKEENKRRAEARENARPRKRSTHDSCTHAKETRLRLKTRKWKKAVRFLDPFIKAQTSDGLVLTNEGVDLSTSGSTRILKKAFIVRFFCKERINGATSADAVQSFTRLYPKEDRMNCTRSVHRYLQQFFVNWGFYETGAGKYVRDTIWGNAALVYAMKVFIKKNMYAVVKERAAGDTRGPVCPRRPLQKAGVSRQGPVTRKHVQMLDWKQDSVVY
jgi:hypothetical protein